MADDAPAPTPAASPDANAVIQQYIQQIMQGSGPVTGPAAPATPAVNPNLPITSLLGEAFGGGVSPLYPMSEAQQTQAGNAALLNFGIGMLQNASGPVRHSLGQAVASGLLGAQGSLAGVREGQAQMLDVQNKQQQMGLEKIKTILPLLQLQEQMKISSGSNPLASDAPGGGIAATGAPITAPSGATPAFTGDLEKDRQIIAQRESGGDPTKLNYVALADPTAYARGATASGKYQFVNSTWQDGLKLAGLDPSKYPTAMSAPESVQDQVFTAVYKRDGTKPWDASTFKQNWVPTPTGQMILANVVPGGKPVATTASPATTTASAAPTAPPGVQMGGAPPAPPGGSAGPYAGGGFGAALGGPAAPTTPTAATTAPANTPEQIRAIAIAQAKDSGQPVPIHGMQGTVAYPNGNIGPPPGGGLGRGGQVSGDVGAMQAGRRIAATTPADGTLAAGPAARPPTAPSSPWPATTTTIGNYNDTPATAPSTVTPPAQPTPQVSTQAQQPDTRPDVELTPEQYVLRHFVPATDADRQTFTVPANPAALQAAQLAVQGAQRAQAAAAQDRQNAFTPEARAKAGEDYTKATQALQTANATVADLQGKADIATTTGAAKFDEDQRQRLTTTYNQLQAQKATAAENAQNRQNQIDIEKLKGQQAIQQAGVTSDIQAGQKALEAVNTTRDGAQDTVNNLEIAKNFSKLAGTSGFLQQWPQVRNMLVRNNLLSSDEVQQMTAQQGLDAVMNKVILSMRAGSGMSRMTNFDLQFLENTAPNSFTPDQMRPAMFAAIQTAATRQVQYVDRVNELHANGMPVWQARQQADTDLGHMVKETPTTYPQGDPRAGQPMSADDQNKWIIRNVTPGTFYTQPNGALAIRGEPKQAQQ